MTEQEGIQCLSEGHIGTTHVDRHIVAYEVVIFHL